MPVSAARQIAFEVLCRVASQGAYASDLLNARLGPRMARADASLATEITLGVLRWQRLIDFLLERSLDRQVERLDLEVLIALRLGFYQLRYLARVPAHAAVGESVELAKRAGKRSAAALVNAALRRAAPEAKVSREELERLLPAGASAAERAAILYSHSTWLVERWMKQFGAGRALLLLEANNRPAPLSCAVLDSDQATAVTASLEADGLEVAPGRWLRSALTLSGGNPAAVEAFRLGQITTQDEASQMVAHLFMAQRGQTALDLCAAPGGKTILLARSVAPDGFVVAADLHAHRCRSLQEQLARTRTLNVFPVALDATRPLPFVQTFDRILVDAPCSGTGTLARNPEIRWRLEAGDLGNAHRCQVAMLSNALPLLAGGGRLVYATCSFEPEENEQVVLEVLAENKEFQIVQDQAALAPHLREGCRAADLFDRQGFFRTFPPESKTDGFFVALIERRA